MCKFDRLQLLLVFSIDASPNAWYHKVKIIKTSPTQEHGQEQEKLRQRKQKGKNYEASADVSTRKKWRNLRPLTQCNQNVSILVLALAESPNSFYLRLLYFASGRKINTKTFAKAKMRLWGKLCKLYVCNQALPFSLSGKAATYAEIKDNTTNKAITLFMVPARKNETKWR